MLIKYKGGRSFYEVTFNRQPYYFTSENNRTVDIKEQRVIQYIFSLPNSTEFEVIEKPQEVIFNTQNNATTNSTQDIEIKTLEINPKKQGKLKKNKR